MIIFKTLCCVPQVWNYNLKFLINLIQFLILSLSTYIWQKSSTEKKKYGEENDIMKWKWL